MLVYQRVQYLQQGWLSGATRNSNPSGRSGWESQLSSKDVKSQMETRLSFTRGWERIRTEKRERSSTNMVSTNMVSTNMVYHILVTYGNI